MTLEQLRTNLLTIAEIYRKVYPQLRIGQTIYNIVAMLHDNHIPEEYDCFYDDNKIDNFIKYYYENIM